MFNRRLGGDGRYGQDRISRRTGGGREEAMSGEARKDKARLGRVRPGETRQDKAKQGKAGQGKARWDEG